MSPSASSPFPVRVLGTTFQNPVLLAAGTAAFGREVDGVIDLDALGGIITKAVTPEPRQGHPAPRVDALRRPEPAGPGLHAARVQGVRDRAAGPPGKALAAALPLIGESPR